MMLRAWMRPLPLLCTAWLVLAWGIQFALPVIYPVSPIANDLVATLIPPFTDAAHPLGTDDLGRDLLSRVLWGGSAAMQLSMVAVLASLIIGLALGIVAATAGRVADVLIARAADMQLALPALVFGLIVLALVGNGFWTMVLVISLSGWPFIFRIARSAIAEIRATQYVEAARVSGVTSARIALRHFLPGAAPVIVTAAMLEFSRNFMLVSALNYIGLGIQPPTPDWGAMIASGQSGLSYAWWLVVMPAVALFSVILAANSLGDSLQSAQQKKGSRSLVLAP